MGLRDIADCIKQHKVPFCVIAVTVVTLFISCALFGYFGSQIMYDNIIKQKIERDKHR